MLSSFLRRSLLMGGPLVEKTSTVLVLSSSRCVHSTRVLWKMDEKVRDDRREMMKTMPKPDEGTPGETSLDMGFLRKADLFPDEDTPNQMFGGMLFKDIHIVDVRCSKNNTLMSCHTAGKSRDKVAYNSCSKEGFKNCRKATNVAAQATGISFARMLLEKGVRYIRVRIQGLGPGRVACLKGMQMGGLEVVAIMDTRYDCDKYCVSMLKPVEVATEAINSFCKDIPPWKLVLISSACTLSTLYFYRQLQRYDEIWATLKLRAIRLVLKLPKYRKELNDAMAKIDNTLTKDFEEVLDGMKYCTSLPEHGLGEEETIRELERNLKLGHYKATDGTLSGTVYHAEAANHRVQAKALDKAAWTNPLHADVFPGVRKMEAEVVAMCCRLFHGGPSAGGTMTLGGTESILLACLAYRNKAQTEKGIDRPEIVCSVATHSAFDKAAFYFGMKIRHVPVDPVTQRIKVRDVKRAINRNTCMLVASAPSFPHGIIDPVTEFAQLGLEYGIPVHVDACLGGFLLCFMEDAGFSPPPFDFRVPGVTSISADTHKYAYCIKGSSVILYKDKDLRNHQVFVQPSWTGGVYATATTTGSRPGALVAATWAALMFRGKSGFIETTRKVVNTARYIEEKIRAIPGLKTLGRPDTSVIPIFSDRFSIYRFADELSSRGYNLSLLQYPPAIHLAVTLCHTEPGIADSFINACQEAAAEILKSPDSKTSGSAVMYGVGQEIPDRSIIANVAKMYVDHCYNTVNASPGKTSAANGAVKKTD